MVGMEGGGHMGGAPVEGGKGWTPVNSSVNCGRDWQQFGTLVVFLISAQASMGNKQGLRVASQEWSRPWA